MNSRKFDPIIHKKYIICFFSLVLLLLIGTYAAFATTETINYTYDEMLRLIKVQYGDGTVIDYIYDNSGNRLIKTTTLPGAPSDNPPNAASNPNIPNGATQIGTSPTLSWTGGDPDGGDQVAYYLYLGTSPDNLQLVSSGLQTSYTAQLNSLTTYYWKIVSTDNHNVQTPGFVWSFTTGNELPIASFNFQPAPEVAPYAIRFVDTSTGPVYNIVSWAWDFNNDGVVDSRLQNPTFTFNSPGLFAVTLTVTDAEQDGIYVYPHQ